MNLIGYGVDMGDGWIFAALLAVPVAGMIGLTQVRNSFRLLYTLCALVSLQALVIAWAGWRLVAGPAGGLHAGWFMIDALSWHHLMVMAVVFTVSTWYAVSYFKAELAANTITERAMRRFGSLWCGALGAMTLVLTSDNLGLLWIGVETTTLMTAFLICLHRTPASLEAMWKYLLMCSVGVAFAFMGNLLIVAAARGTGLGGGAVLLSSMLRQCAGNLNQPVVKLAYLFLIVGYGTKVGLAPLHSWLPDAHSQAPAPVSALFSGFLLNTALYAILRVTGVVEAAVGNTGWALGVLRLFGLVSILVAAAFILSQSDVKRLLAYHSVEHMGIIAVGVGLGGGAIWAALYHVFNHSLCKTLAFCSAGRLGQLYGTHDMGRLKGVMARDPVWGTGLVGSLLALIGMAPFALFVSEFQIVKAGVQTGQWISVGIFLAGTCMVFAGALQHVLEMAWGEATEHHEVVRRSRLEIVLVTVCLVGLVVAGTWMPAEVRDFLMAAGRIVEGR